LACIWSPSFIHLRRLPMKIIFNMHNIHSHFTGYVQWGISSHIFQNQYHARQKILGWFQFSIQKQHAEMVPLLISILNRTLMKPWAFQRERCPCEMEAAAAELDEGRGVRVFKILNIYISKFSKIIWLFFSK